MSSSSKTPVMVTPKAWYESKTIWVNAVTFVIALLGLLVGPEALGVIPDNLEEHWAKGVLMLSAFLNVILRSLTGQPLSAK
jgi:hypothetical protein